MIITRTPFRISFFGGGTDYPAWFRENGSGGVLAGTIDKYCYVMCRYLPPFFDHKYRIRYTRREETNHIAEIEHPSVRECLQFSEIEEGVEILHNSDLPANSGLGSSSAFTVGLLQCLHGLKGRIRTKRQLALEAIHIEQERIKENVGCQDQVLASFGGLNRISFGGSEMIRVDPLTISRQRREGLEKHVMLFFTGLSRRASSVAEEQIRLTPSKHHELSSLMAVTDQGHQILCDPSGDFIEFGNLLREAWEIKRSLSSKISNPTIDEIYQAGIEGGATGGKLLGAGGGGFMLFVVAPHLQERVKERLKGLLHIPFHFGSLGSQVIYYAEEQPTQAVQLAPVQPWLSREETTLKDADGVMADGG